MTCQKGGRKKFIVTSYSFKKIRDYVHRLNKANRIIIATIPPKDLRHSVEKYPTKADIDFYRISTRHKAAYERFINRVNENFVNQFNEDETGIHLALHTNLRVHRSRGRASKFVYSKLYDGIHPRKFLKRVRFEKIERTVEAFHGHSRH